MFLLQQVVWFESRGGAAANYKLIKADLNGDHVIVTFVQHREN